MDTKKLYLFAALPVFLLLVFYATTAAFHLISAPSDMSVALGVVLIAIILFAVIRILLATIKYLFK